ncbi:MAG: NRDE family protein [Desulfuromonadaceae bacterium]|nr:NRDE family protein [Desulfuromonadaceae bacterium]MDD5107307.1 NRDE family protein [Desulfuromonadaceae bacterium]
MCLIVFAFDCHPDYQLILGANRDEFRYRPTEPAGFWNSAPYLLAGRDKQAGGTWMGVTTAGKFAAITNYRDPRLQVIDPPSRGTLVSTYLLDAHVTPEEYQATLNRDGKQYDGFNFLYGTRDKLYYFTNRGGSSGPVSRGIHGLSNHLLDTQWAKVTTAKSRLESIVQHYAIESENIFDALSDPVPFADNLLPDTGVGLDRERMLSPLFIENETYGTRSATVILVARNGNTTFIERVFDHSSGTSSTQKFTFQQQLLP